MLIEANLNWRYEDTESGLVAPWYTLPTLEWLKKQDVSKWIVFEFGCGYSTIWWRLNAHQVFSVDDNNSWAMAMGARWATDKKEYLHIEKWYTTIADKIFYKITDRKKGEEGLYDCIVIDGTWRLECLEVAHNFIATGGYIIIDNWGQEDFPYTQEAEELLKGWDKQLFKQPNHSKWITAVFKRP